MEPTQPETTPAASELRIRIPAAALARELLPGAARRMKQQIRRGALRIGKDEGSGALSLGPRELVAVTACAALQQSEGVTGRQVRRLYEMIVGGLEEGARRGESTWFLRDTVSGVARIAYGLEKDEPEIGRIARAGGIELICISRFEKEARLTIELVHRGAKRARAAIEEFQIAMQN